MRIFVYPGSFDPVTLGHMDIIERAVKLCDKLIVAVLVNNAKDTVFTLEERVELLKMALAGRDNIEVDSFRGLLANYMPTKGAATIVRGLRAVSDFDYELQTALLNKSLNNDIETIFMMTKLDNLFLSSGMIRELAKHKGDFSSYVPETIVEKIKEKYESKERR